MSSTRRCASFLSPSTVRSRTRKSCGVLLSRALSSPREAFATQKAAAPASVWRKERRGRLTFSIVPPHSRLAPLVAERQHKPLPPALERPHIALTEHLLERGEARWIPRLLGQKPVIKPDEEPLLLEVVAEVARRRVV